MSGAHGPWTEVRGEDEEKRVPVLRVLEVEGTEGKEPNESTPDPRGVVESRNRKPLRHTLRWGKVRVIRCRSDPAE